MLDDHDDESPGASPETDADLAQLAVARFRATGRPAAVVSFVSSGYATLIDAHGDTLAELRAAERFPGVPVVPSPPPDPAA